MGGYGGFNAIRSPREKSGGTTQWPPHMDKFNNCLYSCVLDDLRFSGCYYTWNNRQDAPNHISSKIDRVLVNESWMRTFPYSNAFFPTPRLSDHSPVFVSLAPSPKPSPKPFRFFDFLADHPMFIPTIQGVWRNVVLGNPMFCVCQKLSSLQGEFKKLNTKEFSAISDRVTNAKVQLDNLQAKLGTNPTDPITRYDEKVAFRQYMLLSRLRRALPNKNLGCNGLNLVISAHHSFLNLLAIIGIEA